jgi:threonine synthase
MRTALSRQVCSSCGREDASPPPRGVSPCCGAPLRSEYDAAVARAVGRGPALGVWRYRALLPLPDGAEPVTLGEGATPRVTAPRLAAWLGVRELTLKDEGANPTGSFKDRGLSVAVSLAAAAGVRGLVLPTAGNAGASAAAYGARAGLSVSVHAPESTPRALLEEIRARGARLWLHAGSIADAGRAAAAEAAREGLFPLATFREPGRVEGKKTMGFELLEDAFGAPDAVVYPCGGGTGIVALAQAFAEARTLGWLTGPAPRLYAVQSSGCAPIVRAFDAGADRAEPWPDPVTFASGLRVPVALADRLILSALRATGGGAIAIPEDAITAAARLAARDEGLLPSPEGSAALAGAHALRERGLLRARDRVVVFQTASALKTMDDWAARL